MNNIKKIGLTNFQIKLIALVIMTVAHSALIFNGQNSPDLTRLICISSSGFALFAFLISEGCRHTKNIKKYMLRLFIFAVVVQSFFYIVEYVIKTYLNNSRMLEGLPNLNIFFTLFLGVFSVFSYNVIRKYAELHPENKVNVIVANITAFAPFAISMLMAQYFGVDYTWKGVFLIFGLYIVRKRWMQLIVVAVFIMLQYGGFLHPKYYELLITGQATHFLLPFFGIVPIVLIGFYNGKLGRNWKWFFYAAYLGHYALLGLLYILCIIFAKGW